jgi:16S rRNA (adenine1518-N6/adenine1519-N6)-dimethyltransferase
METGRPRDRPRPSIRTELGELGVRARKSLGQHFLRDTAIADRIVALCRPREGERVVEIGPGLGVLSDRLARQCEDLVLIELDRALAARAVERYQSFPGIRVVEGDALRVDWSDVLGARAVVVGNLPYNVGTAILQRLLEHRRPIRRIVAMVQKEVAERLVADPGTGAYGALSILTQFDCQATLAFPVPPGAFVPPPKVHSAVVILEARAEAPVAVTSDPRFRRLVRMAFQHRRKQLANCLRNVISEPKETLARVGIDPMRRPETLTMEEFALLERESRDA